MKNKGFTLVEFLSVLIVITLLMFLVSEVIVKNLEDTNKTLSSITEDLIISSAREYVKDNILDADVNNVYCITYSILNDNNYLNEDMLPKIDNLDIIKSKYIKVIYNGLSFEYFLEDSCTTN